MKRLFAGIVALMLVLASPVARAEDQTSLLLLTDDQIAQIRTNCVATQAILQRLHSSDALARVNLGQQYETIATKLMAPLNSRIALNKLDGVDLAKTSVDFNTKLDEFRALYQQYEETLLRAIQMNCVNQPVAFYDTISMARTDRAAVRVSVVTLGSLASQYGQQFEAFASKTLQAVKTAEGSTQ